MFDIKFSAKDDGKKLFTNCSAKLLKGHFLKNLKGLDAENFPGEKKAWVKKEIKLKT